MAGKIVGVMGGMGPKATVLFMDNVIQKTPVSRDQDHIRMLVDNNPSVPDRTASILNQGESPVTHLQSMAVGLEKMGANFLVMPCNTAHYFYHEIISVINIPFINMIEESSSYICKMKMQANKKVGLLATTGTIKSGIYHDALSKFNLDLLLPTPYQHKVMEGIYAVKKGDFSLDAVKKIEDPVKYLESQGANIIIMGCTEIPMLITHGPKFQHSIKANLVDPADVLAEKTIHLALQLTTT